MIRKHQLPWRWTPRSKNPSSGHFFPPKKRTNIDLFTQPPGWNLQISAWVPRFSGRKKVNFQWDWVRAPAILSFPPTRHRIVDHLGRVGFSLGSLGNSLMIHIYIYTYIHTCMHAYIHTHIHTCMHTYTHTYIHIHTHIHTYIHTYTDIYTYIHYITLITLHYIHTYIQTYRQTYIHTDKHTYIHYRQTYIYM